MIDQVDIHKFLDGEKLKIWPSKTNARQVAREYLASKIICGQIYTEKEINILLNKFHTFNDPAFLRRELCDHVLLRRDNYGYKYWK